MDAQRVDNYLLINRDYFPEEHYLYLRERLLAVEESRWALIQSLQYKDPTLALVLSLLFFLGVAGIDRFYIGDIGLGVGKLITAGGCGVWALVDFFLIMGATREKNVQKLLSVL